LPRLRESRRRIADSKVRIAFGTDVGIFDYSLAAREFSAMVSAGIDPMRALQSATSTAADLLDRSGEIGRIREGYFADIIAVRGNPLEEIAVLEDVGFVMKGGEVVKNDF
jgi:imidazolonepropionase-like amidohydrolase